MNSKAKGKRGELELAAYLREKGYAARRGCQFKGGDDSPDVICSGLPLHFEVKRTEKLSVYEAYAQAVADSQPSAGIPVVAHRRNHQPWLAILSMDDLLALMSPNGFASRGEETGRPLDDDLCDK
jgi:Holliday junction resolvase